MFRPSAQRRISGNAAANPLALIASDYRRHREDQGVLRALLAEGLLASTSCISAALVAGNPARVIDKTS